MLNPFIDEVYFKKTNSVDNAVDAKVIEPAIEKAMDVYLLPLLGTALYNALQAEIEASSVSGDSQTLLDDYIAPCLSKYALYEALPKLMYKIENVSVVKKSAEYAETIDFKELNFLRQIALDDAQYFASKLTKFLCANPTLYPLYENAGTSSDTVYPNAGLSYRTSIYFPNKSRGYNDYRDRQG